MVTVVIVNWNSGELLRQCLADLSLQDLAPTRILVMDNCSTDSSVEGLDSFCGVEVHKLGVNFGFAGGNNHAFELIDTEFVALLNPDAFPEPGWLRELVAAAETYKDVAAFGSCQMIHNSNSLIDGMGDVYHMSGLVWRQGHGFPLTLVGSGPIEIFSPCAGAVLYRTDVVKALGGFDEDFFCYVEDVDLGFRLRLSGYRVMLVPTAVVHHVGSATSGGRHSDFSIYHGHRNLVWSYVKNMPGWLFWACLPLHLAMNVATILWFVIHGKGSVILRSKMDAIFGLPNMWRKRKFIQESRSVSVAEIWSVLDKRYFPSKR